MAILTRACNELFRRRPDERFASLADLIQHCEADKMNSTDIWAPPTDVKTQVQGESIELLVGNEGTFQPNSWSFQQLCQLASVSRDTVNKVSPETAVQIFEDTLPQGSKPLQVHAMGNQLRSIHGASYTRLHNVDVLAVVQECATDFQPPQEGLDGATGLYCGEQDMFCFLIDPAGWADINGEAFAPGFFIWNSEVGRRTVGVQTFWFQKVCQNHIVWDATEVVEYTRKHTANVRDSLDPLRQIIENLVAKRDARRDGFVKVIQKAMTERLGKDAEEVLKALQSQGIPKSIAKEATDIAQKQGSFTIFSLVDALTRMASKLPNAGDRTEADMKASSLLTLAA